MGQGKQHHTRGMTVGVGNVFTVPGKLQFMIPVLRQEHLSLSAHPSLRFEIMVTFQTTTDLRNTNAGTFHSGSLIPHFLSQVELPEVFT